MNIDNAKHVPILNKGQAQKQEERNQLKLNILNNPEAANKLGSLAESLEQNFNAYTKILTNVRVGARIQDVLSKKIWIYEYFSVPMEHDIRTEVIMDLAKKPLTEWNADHFALFYEEGSNPAPRYLLSMLDFCKYVACGVWVVIDMNDQDEKAFLEKTVRS